MDTGRKLNVHRPKPKARKNCSVGDNTKYT